MTSTPLPHRTVPEPLRFRGARLARGALGLLRTRYPRFLWGFPPSGGEIPVYIFHEIETETFTRQLERLRAGGYRTLSLDEFLALAARKSGSSPRRCVLLTFDDARLNFHQCALPALRATRSRAALFAPTLWLDPSRPAGAERFMSWGQLRECVASGLVDVGSHAHRHALVFDSDRLAGFATPWNLARHDIYDWPMRRERTGDALGRPALGTPIYSAVPLLSARARYLESVALREACMGLVERCGAPEFFSRPDCHARLLDLHRARAGALAGRFLDAAQFEALVASEFELSQAAFREHLGFAPAAFAYPWALGSELSLRLARRFGIRCAFGVATDYRRARSIARAGSEPLPVFGRVKGEWLEFLPGGNPVRLVPLLARKVTSFVRQQHLAH